MASPKALPEALPLLFFFGFLLFSFSSSPAAEGAKADFFYLTLMWPGALCSRSGRCCLPTTGEPASDFFVEALESYDSATGRPLNNCSTSSCRFTVNSLRPFIDDMYAYWPDVGCPSNNGLERWRSTWCAYGTCSNLTIAQYFQRALQLRAKIDLLNVLAFYDIVPSKTNSYNLKDIESALMVNYGFSAVVECNPRRSWRRENDQLYKVRICVSADAQRIISCPITGISNCFWKVRFPPFTADMLGPGSGSNPIEMPTAKGLVM